MTVFLVGDYGGRTAFKITTARVLSSLDSLFAEALIDFKEHTWDGHKDHLDALSWRALRGNIYFCELDDEENVAKKLTVKLIKPYTKEWVTRNKAKFNEAVIIRKENMKREEEKNK